MCDEYGFYVWEIRPVGGGVRGVRTNPPWDIKHDKKSDLMMWTGQKKSEQQENMDG